MKGSHHIAIESSRLKYEFDIKRNITIIQGDSATGKTTLIDLLNTYGRYGVESGIMLNSDVPCIVFSANPITWQDTLKTYNDSIIFFDEDYSFIFSKDFAETIRDSSNYYVLITRQPLYNLPYSIKEIYGIRTTGKYHFPEKIYHEFYPIYTDVGIYEIKDAVVLVEDTGSGFQLYQKICGADKCQSAGGNSKIVGKLENMPHDKHVTVIADGAAFGAYVASVLAISKRMSDVQLYFPESFEWIILKSGIIKVDNIDNILERPEDFIESRAFFSWERFFEDILVKATIDDPIRRYSKSKLSSFYYEGKNKDSILSIMPKGVFDKII